MKLTENDKLEASIAMRKGDTFIRGDVILFPVDGAYCVQKTVGPVSDKNRVITKSWNTALKSFETFAA